MPRVQLPSLSKAHQTSVCLTIVDKLSSQNPRLLLLFFSTGLRSSSVYGGGYKLAVDPIVTPSTLLASNWWTRFSGVSRLDSTIDASAIYSRRVQRSSTVVERLIESKQMLSSWESFFYYYLLVGFCPCSSYGYLSLPALTQNISARLTSQDLQPYKLSLEHSMNPQDHPMPGVSHVPGDDLPGAWSIFLRCSDTWCGTKTSNISQTSA